MTPDSQSKPKSKTHLIFAMTGSQAVPGGIARANLNVMGALSDLINETGGRLTILSLLESVDDRPEFLPSGVQFKAFQGNQKLFAANLLRHVSRNTLFCFDHVSLSLPLLPLAAAGLARTVIFNHGSESWKRIQRLNKLSIRCATKCLTNSHYTLNKMRERIKHFHGEACPLGLPPDFPLNQEIVERNGVPLQLEAADTHVYALGDRVILLVARMLPTEREKGHYELLEVLPDLLNAFPDLQTVFAGGGQDRERLAELARAKGVAHAVFFPGFLPVEALSRLYRHCYAFVMPSKQEGFGLAYLEAMNYGKACVGCFDQGAEDVILDGETGFLVHDPGNQKELLTVIDRLLGDPDKARAMGRAGFQRLHKHFTSHDHQARVKERISALL